MTATSPQISATDAHSGALSAASREFVILMTERNALAAAHLEAEARVTQLERQRNLFGEILTSVGDERRRLKADADRFRQTLEAIRDGCSSHNGETVAMGAKKARRMAAEELEKNGWPPFAGGCAVWETHPPPSEAQRERVAPHLSTVDVTRPTPTVVPGGPAPVPPPGWGAT